jgi:hypothetical protein
MNLKCCGPEDCKCMGAKCPCVKCNAAWTAYQKREGRRAIAVFAVASILGWWVLWLILGRAH